MSHCKPSSKLNLSSVGGRNLRSPKARSRSRCAEHALFAAFGGAGEEDLGGVHVALGDRALCMAGASLHIDLRVTRRRGVCKRGVAEVVERPERLRNPGLLERRLQVAADELVRVKRLSQVRVAEDQVVVVSIDAPPP